MILPPQKNLELLKVAHGLVLGEQRRLAGAPYDPYAPVSFEDPRDEVEHYLAEIAGLLNKFLIAASVANLRALRNTAPAAAWAEACVKFLEETSQLRQ